MIPEIEYKTCYLDGRLGRAREILRKLIAMHPDCGAFYADLALVYLQQGEMAKAREAAEKARALVASRSGSTVSATAPSISARYSDVLAAVGFVRESIGDHKGALSLYEEAKTALSSAGKRRLWIDHAVERVRETLSGHEGLEGDPGQEEEYKISYFLDPNLGPDALRLVCEHMNRLAMRGHKVHAIARKTDKLTGRQDGIAAEIIRVPAREELYERVPDSDIVVATSWRTAFDAARVHGAVPFYLVQPSPGFEPNGNQASKNLEASFKLPLRLIASSDYVRGVLKARYNRRAEVVPYGVDLETTPSPSLGANPNIQATYEIQGVKDRPARLLVVGSDEDEWMENIYAALRLILERRQNDVEVVRVSPSRRLDFSFHVTTWVENPDSSQLARVFSDCDIFITGSPEGIFSQAALAAMACGLPSVLCARDGESLSQAAKEIVSHAERTAPDTASNVSTPYLPAPLNDAGAIAGAIETLIDDEGLRKKVGSNGQEIAKTHAWDRVIDQLEGVLRSAVTDVQLSYPSAAALGVGPSAGTVAGSDGAASGFSRRRPTLSLCMIVKNEERFLARCLDSVKDVVDEMIIVDTGSTDRTVEIAKSYGAKVYFHEWKNDFAEARNASLEKATGDWILVMDADEVLAASMYTVIHRLIDGGVRAIYCARISNRKSIDDNQSLFDHFMNRLFPSDPDIRFVGQVHERIISLSNEHLPVHSILDFVIFHIGYQGEILAGRRKHARNLAILEQCIRKNPSDPYYHYCLGGTYHAMGKVNLAIDELSEAYRLCSERPDDGMSKAIAVSSLCVLSRIVYSFRGRDLAEQYLREALDISPTNTDVLYSLAEIARMKTEWNTGKDLYIKAISHGNSPFWGLTHDPATATWKAWIGLGVCQTALGDFDHAHQSFERAASLCPSPAELLGPLVHVRNHLTPLHDNILSRSLRSWVDEFINHTARSASRSLDAAHGGDGSHLQEDGSTNKHQDDLGKLDAYLKAYRAGELTELKEFHALAVLLDEAGLLNDAFRVYRDALNLEPTNQTIVDALLKLVNKMRSGLSS